MRVAVGKALDPEDAHSVWAVIIAMAESDSKPLPLVGFANDGVKYQGRDYQNIGVLDILTFKKF